MACGGGHHKPVLTALGAPRGAPELFRYVAFFPLPIRPHRTQPLVETGLGQSATLVVVKFETNDLPENFIIYLTVELAV